MIYPFQIQSVKEGIDNLDENYGLDRIADGLRANQNQFPFHVAITASSSSNHKLYLCSGSLISNIFVLTAASCTIRQQRYDLRLSSVTFYTGGISLTSHTAFNHPQFNPITRQNDASLIQLPRSITTADGPVLATLPTAAEVQQNLPFANQFGRVAGYGLIGNHQSPVLQFEIIRVIENNDIECRNALAANNLTNSQSFLCASRVHHINESINCAGDIGSPIFLQLTSSNNRVVQVGIALNDAHSLGCRNSTTLFTRLTDVARWIRTVATGV